MKTGQIYIIWVLLLLFTAAGGVMGQDLTARDLRVSLSSLNPDQGVHITEKENGFIEIALLRGESSEFIRDIKVTSRESGGYLKLVTGIQKESGREIAIIQFTDADTLDHIWIREKDQNEFSIMFLDGDLGTDLAFDYYNELLRGLPFDVDFKGGSGEKLADHIKEKYLETYRKLPRGLFRVIPASVVSIRSDIQIPDILNFPAFRARKIRLNEVREVLNRFVSPILLSGIDPFSVETELMPSGTSRKTKEGNVIRGFILNLRISFSRSANLGIETFIHRLRKPESKEDVQFADIVPALEQAWFLRGHAVAAQVHFHEQTRLVMITGTPSELNTARQVLDQLAGPTNSVVPQPVVRKADGNEAIDKLQRQNEELKRKYDTLIDAIKELKNSVDALYVK